MSLKASIVGLQIKQLKGALQYLAKIGDLFSNIVCGILVFVQISDFLQL